MQDVYADSNEGMVVKLIISVEQGEKKTPRKPTQVRVNWFQNFQIEFDIAWCVMWSLVQKEVLNLLNIHVLVLTLGIHIPLCFVDNIGYSSEDWHTYSSS